MIGGGCWTFALKLNAVEGIEAICDPIEEGDRSVNGDSALIFAVGMGMLISSGTEV